MTQPSSGSTPPGAPRCYRHGDRETGISCQRCARPICPDCMNSASVGFQCPDCVREGHRSTRQHQGRFGGARSANPMLTSQVLVGINVAVWLAVMVTGGAASRLLDTLMLTPLGRCVSSIDPDYWFPNAGRDVCVGEGSWVQGFATGALWQPLTSAFTHYEIWHIGFNMLALWFLGPQVEALLGRMRFLAVYLGSALVGSLVVLWLSDAQGSSLGASGAIWGLMGALLVLALRAKSDVRGLLVWIGLNVVMSFTIPDISWQAHFGGLLGGALLTAAFVFTSPRPASPGAVRDLATYRRRDLVQWVGVAAVLAVVVALSAVRALSLA